MLGKPDDVDDTEDSCKCSTLPPAASVAPALGSKPKISLQVFNHRIYPELLYTSYTHTPVLPTDPTDRSYSQIFHTSYLQVYIQKVRHNRSYTQVPAEVLPKSSADRSYPWGPPTGPQ